MAPKGAKRKLEPTEWAGIDVTGLVVQWKVKRNGCTKCLGQVCSGLRRAFSFSQRNATLFGSTTPRDRRLHCTLSSQTNSASRWATVWFGSYTVEMERLHLAEVAEATAVVAMHWLTTKYAALPQRNRVGVKEIHADLTRVYTALSQDDGNDIWKLSVGLKLTDGGAWAQLEGSNSFRKDRAPARRTLGLGPARDLAETKTWSFLTSASHVGLRLVLTGRGDDIG